MCVSTFPRPLHAQVVRTLADQVRKRERIKRQLVKVWQDSLHLVGATAWRRCVIASTHPCYDRHVTEN